MGGKKKFADRQYADRREEELRDLGETRPYGWIELEKCIWGLEGENGLSRARSGRSPITRARSKGFPLYSHQMVAFP